MLQEEPDAKWPLLTLTRVRESIAALQLHLRTVQPAPQAAGCGATGATPVVTAHPPAGSGRSPVDAEGGAAQQAAPDKPPPVGRPPASSAAGSAASLEAVAYRQLSQLDPLRAGYYADASAGRAHVVLRTAGAS